MRKVDQCFQEPTEFNYDISGLNEVATDPDCQFYDFKNAHVDGLGDFFSSVTWDHVFANCPTVNDSVNSFYRKLFDGLEQFVPVLTKKSAYGTRRQLLI